MLLWHIRLMMVLLGLHSMIGVQPTFANAFEPPPNQDAPSSTAGGGSRPTDSSCFGNRASEARAIALAPQNFVGLSTQAQPTVWLHLPEANINGIELSLFDQQLNGLVQHQIERPNAAGFYPIQFPETVQLDEERIYYWSAALICHPSRRTEDWVVGGWIRYQPLPRSEIVDSGSIDVTHSTPPSRSRRSRRSTIQSSSTSEQETVLAQANQYIDNGYWYDALATLMPLIHSPSSSPFVEPLLEPLLEATWDTLIRQANLTPLDIYLNDDV